MQAVQLKTPWCRLFASTVEIIQRSTIFFGDQIYSDMSQSFEMITFEILFLFVHLKKLVIHMYYIFIIRKIILYVWMKRKISYRMTDSRQFYSNRSVVSLKKLSIVIRESRRYKQGVGYTILWIKCPCVCLWLRANTEHILRPQTWPSWVMGGPTHSGDQGHIFLNMPFIRMKLRKNMNGYVMSWRKDPELGSSGIMDSLTTHPLQVPVGYYRLYLLKYTTYLYLNW